MGGEGTRQCRTRGWRGRWLARSRPFQTARGESESRGSAAQPNRWVKREIHKAQDKGRNEEGSVRSRVEGARGHGRAKCLALIRHVNLLVDGHRPATAAGLGVVARAGGVTPRLVALERRKLGSRDIPAVAPADRRGVKGISFVGTRSEKAGQRSTTHSCPYSRPAKL
jgi:hypothetical protein